ncbi:hypothetical protein [Legionella cardiaca]|uniref:Secreted protein n=1 Tax=Legionella cardiaca TaxID=1071983 RepID=A0ABY8AQ77_9GAMM|nr:hypothetical protein [Legionella cardiaca]WED42698.1 hypothetical protein PXX05_12445 [Legionella cardiaca]
MKTILFLWFMSMSFISSGAVIFIKGLPMALEHRNEVYILPPIVPANAITLYITMDGINKICVLDRHTNAVFEQINQVNFLLSGVKTEWNCYAYETTVIKVLPW